MPETALLRQLQGFSLTTAEILYRLPDYPRLLQSYIWQDYDLAPNFPKLTDFLDFWAANLDGPLYRVRVAHRRPQLILTGWAGHAPLSGLAVAICGALNWPPARVRCSQRG